MSVSIYNLASRNGQSTVITSHETTGEIGQPAEYSLLMRGSSVGSTALTVRSPSMSKSFLLQVVDSQHELQPWHQTIDGKIADGMIGLEARVYMQGFPMRCFHGLDLPDAWPEPAAYGLVRTGEIGEHAICYYPRWLGLAADTAFWGAAWLGVLSVPIALRGKRRRAKGLCPTCAYDLKGNLAGGCPECGWGRE